MRYLGHEDAERIVKALYSNAHFERFLDILEKEENKYYENVILSADADRSTIDSARGAARFINGLLREIRTIRDKK